MRVFIKYPDEIERWYVDFTNQLGIRTIASATIEAVSGLTVATTYALSSPIPPGLPTINGSQVLFWVGGGTAGTTYNLTIKATLSDGAVLPACLHIKVEDC